MGILGTWDDADHQAAIAGTHRQAQEQFLNQLDTGAGAISKMTPQGAVMDMTKSAVGNAGAIARDALPLAGGPVVDLARQAVYKAAGVEPAEPWRSTSAAWNQMKGDVGDMVPDVGKGRALLRSAVTTYGDVKPPVSVAVSPGAVRSGMAGSPDAVTPTVVNAGPSVPVPNSTPGGLTVTPGSDLSTGGVPGKNAPPPAISPTGTPIVTAGPSVRVPAAGQSLYYPGDPRAGSDGPITQYGDPGEGRVYSARGEQVGMPTPEQQAAKRATALATDKVDAQLGLEYAKQVARANPEMGMKLIDTYGRMLDAANARAAGGDQATANIAATMAGVGHTQAQTSAIQEMTKGYAVDRQGKLYDNEGKLLNMDMVRQQIASGKLDQQSRELLGSLSAQLGDAATRGDTAKAAALSQALLTLHGKNEADWDVKMREEDVLNDPKSPAMGSRKVQIPVLFNKRTGESHDAGVAPAPPNKAVNPADFATDQGKRTAVKGSIATDKNGNQLRYDGENWVPVR